MNARILWIAAAVGVAATVVMDLGSGLGILLGVPGRGPLRSGYRQIGRWFTYLLRGTFKHADILATPPVKGEFVIGVVVHYLIGTILTFIYLVFLSIAHLAATPLLGFAYGLATTVCPWFLLFPSLGMGWMGRDAPKDIHPTRASIFNHAFFGLGLALWTSLLGPF